MLSVLKIVSGGQTGVGCAALDAALQTGIDCSGWCPAGRKAEDRIMSEHYPLSELENASHRKRTKHNVIDSDGIVIIYFDTLSECTKQSLLFCMQQKKPSFPRLDPGFRVASISLEK